VGIGGGAGYNNVKGKGHRENDRIGEGLGNAMNKNDIGGRFPPVCPFVAWMAAMGLGLAVMPAPAPAQEPGRPGGYSPEEARGRMVVPEGFHVEVFASEPMIRQPLTACFDERGRAWVIEYLQYPHPAGLKPVTVDQYLRTQYDRFPEPPPRGPRGVDRVKILEDTDGDGAADKATTFVEGLNMASGLAVGHGGVFVGQAPYLLFYPDRDRDDRPDGDPEVLLTGFGLEDTHATVNSLQWGPDGWLYGAQGSTVTAKIRGIEFQQGIWRYHPRTKQFELFAEGGGNTWGLDFDAAGNAFGSSNGAFVAFHMVQGGNYWKGFAKHGPLHNPYTFGYFHSLEYLGDKVGGHVTPGGIIYKGDNFPASFRGKFIGGNLLSNAVYWHDLEPRGSTFAARHGGTLIDARDSWFRPIDVLVGPEGAAYVVDWYDRRASHLDPRDTWDKTNGRIYRVVYGRRPEVAPFDLARRSSAELVDLRTSGNDWYAGEARRILAERRDPGVVPRLKALLAEDRDEPIALRDLWALHVSGGLDDSTALGLLEHPVAGVRRWVVRLLGDDRRMSESLRATLVDLARDEPDALVRSQLAASCQRWGAGDALAILDPLLRRSEDVGDAQVPLLIWWALERQLRQDRDAVIARLARPDTEQTPLVRDVLLERVARVLASRAEPDDFAACARLLAAAPGAHEVDRLIAGMEKGLEGHRLDAVPPALERPLARLWDRTDPSVALIRFAARLGSGPAARTAVERVAAPGTPEAERLALIEVLGQLGKPEVLTPLLDLLDRKPSQAVQLALVGAVGSFNRPEVATRLLAHYPALAGSVRPRVLGLLCSRKEWAEPLIEAIAQGRLSPQELKPPQVLQVVQLGDPDLTRRVEKVWGRVPGPGSPEKVRRIAEVRGLLPEGDKGSADRGASVFKENCAVCHRLFDEGEQIGPDLTGAERSNLDFLLTSVVDPSALIRKEYQAQTVALGDGRVLTGLVVEETDKTVTLVDSNRQKTVVPRDQVEEMKPSAVSLMPEGQLDKLRDDQVRDLFKYLQSRR
jgi:putative membrane-bound dehydrogenase-like protein